jgi:hypothetical protein
MPNHDYNSEFYMDTNLMDKEKYIAERIQASGLVKKVPVRTLENLLRFLYTSAYQGKANRLTIRKYAHYFSELERLILYRLETRCTGSERFNYGINAVMAIKRDKYACVVCGEKDIRCIEIDHINGRTHEKKNKEQYYEVNEFQTLCANHHRIKTVTEKQQN